MKGLITFVVLAATPTITQASEPPREIQRHLSSQSSRQLSTETENFIVRSLDSHVRAKELAELCESWRCYLAKKWLPDSEVIHWQPKCQIIVHATRQGYLRAVGRGGAQTFGSALTKFDKGRISQRRIDLLVDRAGQVMALPHELTHIVLADAFPGELPPTWLDEGIATLSDNQRKQSLHHRDCRDAVNNHSSIRMIQLLKLERLSNSQRAAFYGQSVSLVSFLSQRGGTDQLVPFVQRALEVGYDVALREQFELNGVQELERLWISRVRTSSSRTTARLISTRSK